MSVVDWFAIFFITVTSLTAIGCMAQVLLGTVTKHAKELIEFYLTRKKEMIEALEAEMEADQTTQSGKKFRSN
jgi:hypothetical protein